MSRMTPGNLTAWLAQQTIQGDVTNETEEQFDRELEQLIERRITAIHNKEHPMPNFDKATVDALVKNLEDGEADLSTKTDADGAAQAAAGQAAADLSAAQATNKANVAAIKSYFANLDDSGNPPAPVVLPPASGGSPAGTGTTNPATTA